MSESTASSELAAWTPAPTVEELEQRIQRLEDAVANLADTQVIEDRIRASVLEQLRQEPIRLDAKPMDANGKDDAAAMNNESHPALMHSSAFFLNQDRPELSTLTVLGEIWWEIRTLYCMVRDPLYSFSWTCRLAILLPFVFVLWHYLVGFLIFPLELTLFLCLAYFVFKMVGRELRRYQVFVKHRRRPT